MRTTRGERRRVHERRAHARVSRGPSVTWRACGRDDHGRQGDDEAQRWGGGGGGRRQR